MLERLKTALVDSYVGAIALGVLLSEGISRFLGIFTEPAARWITQRQYWMMINSHSEPPGFPYMQEVSQAVASALYLLVGYGLLRWLYYPIGEMQDREHTAEPEEHA
jgi:hypothetical protein